MFDFIGSKYDSSDVVDTFLCSNEDEIRTESVT